MPRRGSFGGKNSEEEGGDELDTFYEVEDLLDFRWEGNKQLCLVKWKPSPTGNTYEDTWEPYKNLSIDMRQLARKRWPGLTIPRPGRKGQATTAASAKAAVKSAFTTSTSPPVSVSSSVRSDVQVNGSPSTTSQSTAGTSSSKSPVKSSPSKSDMNSTSSFKSASNSPIKSPVKSPMKPGSQSTSSTGSQADSSGKDSQKTHNSPVRKQTGGTKTSGGLRASYIKHVAVKRRSDHAYNKKTDGNSTSSSQKKGRTNGSQATSGTSEVKKREDYLSWDEYFMSVAQLSAQRSKDPNTQVGACIVNQEKKIVAIGYNGMPIGLSDDEFPWSKTGPFLEKKYAYVCHAEMNAIINRNSADLTNCTLYVGLFPCNECVKLIIQSRISNVVYLSDKNAERDETKAAKIMLKAAGIQVKRFASQRELVAIQLQEDQ